MPDQKDWDRRLALVEASNNNHFQDTIKTSPAELVYGAPLNLPHALDLPVRVPQARQFGQGISEALSRAQKCMTNAQARMKQQVDQSRREVSFFVGDEVLLNLRNRPIKGKEGVRKLKAKWIGPLEV